MSLTCVLNALTATGSGLLRRQLDFRALNIIQLTSYIVGYLMIGLSMAYAGAGVWTLVAAWLGQAATALLLTYARTRFSLRPLLWYEGARRSTHVGLTVFVTNLCNWFLNNLDRVFLGRFLAAHAVGVYAVGYNLANTPNGLFLNALQPAFLATGAKLQDDLPRLRDMYVSVLATIWIVILPLFVLLAVTAPALIGVLYGAVWQESGIVLAILALAMPAYITWGMSTPDLVEYRRQAPGKPAAAAADRGGRRHAVSVCGAGRGNGGADRRRHLAGARAGGGHGRLPAPAGGPARPGAAGGAWRRHGAAGRRRQLGRHACWAAWRAAIRWPLSWAGRCWAARCCWPPCWPGRLCWACAWWACWGVSARPCRPASSAICAPAVASRDNLIEPRELHE